MAGQDVAQEVEKWAELAALDSVAHSAHFPVSCVTSSNSTSVCTSRAEFRALELLFRLETRVLSLELFEPFDPATFINFLIIL